MNWPVIFKPAALADIEEAFAWYEQPATGLGAEFLRRVKLVEITMSREPLLGPVVRAPVAQRSGLRRQWRRCSPLRA